MPYIVYLLQCQDGTLYTGITNDLQRRLRAHKNGTGARYTRAHPPQKILYTETKRTKGLALRREYAIKQMSRGAKLLLCRQGSIRTLERTPLLKRKNKPERGRERRGARGKPERKRAVDKTK